MTWSIVRSLCDSWASCRNCRYSGCKNKAQHIAATIAETVVPCIQPIYHSTLPHRAAPL